MCVPPWSCLWLRQDWPRTGGYDGSGSRPPPAPPSVRGQWPAGAAAAVSGVGPPWRGSLSGLLGLARPRSSYMDIYIHATFRRSFIVTSRAEKQWRIKKIKLKEKQMKQFLVSWVSEVWMVNLCLQCYGGRIIDNLQIDNVKLITQTYKLMTQTYKLILYFYLSGSVFLIRIRIYKGPEYGSTMDPDTKHWFTQ